MTGNSITALPEWRSLKQHHAQMQDDFSLRAAFASDPRRAEKMSLEACGIRADYSKNLIDDATLTQLIAFANAIDLNAKRDALFRGDAINTTEQRAVMHMALRAGNDTLYRVAGRDIMPDIRTTLARMGRFVRAVRTGQWRGHTDQRIRTIINIGIGGSDLGPRLAWQALRSGADKSIDVRFVSNIDSHDILTALDGLDADSTLFVIASKTFGTEETLQNALTARHWLLDRLGGDATAIARHFVAVSTNLEAVTGFGIDPENMFGFWDWVGGRFSLWSAIGLSLALGIGWDGFTALLAGASAMDSHFRDAPFAANLPVLLGLIGFWQIDFWGMTSHAALPYDSRLDLLPHWLQQLDMESNGKSVTLSGEPVDYATAPVIFGQAGTNGQHAFYQQLHQGPSPIPADIILVAQDKHDIPNHRQRLLAHGIAQSQALMRGKNRFEVIAELTAQGLDETAITELAPHKIFPGNRPHSVLLLDRLTPHSFGALLALYEHKIFVQGALWNINSFDQWGVELGKQLAKNIHHDLKSGQASVGLDSSTAALIHAVLAKRGELKS